MLNDFAEQYAQQTGCDEAQAEQAAFVAATLFADLVGLTKIGDYFSGRASEMEGKHNGRTLDPEPTHILDRVIDEPVMTGCAIPANETHCQAAMYQNGYFI